MWKGRIQKTETCTCRPVVKYMLGDVCGRVIWGKSEVLCFPTNQDKAEVHLKQNKNRSLLVHSNMATAKAQHQTSLKILLN